MLTFWRVSVLSSPDGLYISPLLSMGAAWMAGESPCTILSVTSTNSIQTLKTTRKPTKANLVSKQEVKKQMWYRRTSNSIKRKPGHVNKQNRGRYVSQNIPAIQVQMQTILTVHIINFT